MASEPDLECWDIDLDQSPAAAAELGSWTLAGYSWDPVGLVATRKPGMPDPRQTCTRGSGDGSGGSTQNPELGMDVEAAEEGGCLSPEALANAPVYLFQPAGCKLMICQVVGCGVSLEGMKGYFLRHRVCEEHSKAPVLMINGAPSRLCQQCSKFHPVEEFEGSKRTCRVQLDRIRINKRIRRNRKLNAASAAALAATAGLTADGYLAAAAGELPALPATALGGRAKRPADSSGSGEGSWADSRKSRHVAGGGSSIRANGILRAASGARAAAAPAVVQTAAPESLLPDSGGSDTGSLEQPRASLDASGGSTRWQGGGRSCRPPVSPPQPPGLADPSATGAAASPGSAYTGSGCHGAFPDASSGGMPSCYSTYNVSLSQQNPPGAHHSSQVNRGDSANTSSMPTPCAGELGPPGSIVAAAGSLPAPAAAPCGHPALEGGNNMAGLTGGSGMTAAALHAASLQDDAFAAAIAAAVAGGGGGIGESTPDGGVGAHRLAPGAVGFLPPLGTAGGAGVGESSAQGAGSSACQQQAALMQPTTGGYEGVASAWSTEAAMAQLGEGPSEQQRRAAAMAARQLAPPLLMPHQLGGSAASELPRTLHPLLQQQLHQELMLYKHLQQQQQEQLHQHQQQQQRNVQEHMSCPGLNGADMAGASGDGGSSSQPREHPSNLAGVSTNYQNNNERPSEQGVAQTGDSVLNTLLLPQHTQPLQPGQASQAHDCAMGGGGMAGGMIPSQLAADASAAALSRATAVPPHGATPKMDTGDGGRHSGMTGAAATGSGAALSSSKLIRMSLENDDILDDSGALLGSLIDLLQTQAADPRDIGAGAELVRPQWLASGGTLRANGGGLGGADGVSGPGSHRSGNNSLTNAASAGGAGFMYMGMPAAATAAAVLQSTCGLSAAAATALGAGGAGLVGCCAADAASSAALSRAGSGAGSPQSALLAAAGMTAAGTGHRGAQLAPHHHSSLPPTHAADGLLGLSMSAGPVGGMLGGLGETHQGGLGCGAGGGGGFGPAAAAAALAAASLPVPVPGHHPDHRRGVELHRQLSEQQQCLLTGAHQLPSTTTATNDLILQQQLLLAQQLQQQQQQHQQQQQLRLRLLQQQQQLLQLQQAQAAYGMGGGAPPAGLLLSRLLDADSKTHHLSSELNGYLAEKQHQRRQLLASFSTHQLQDAGHVTAAAAIAASSAPTAAALQSAHLSAHLSAGLSAAHQLRSAAMAPSLSTAGLGPLAAGAAGLMPSLGLGDTTAAAAAAAAATAAGLGLGAGAGGGLGPGIGLAGAASGGAGLGGCGGLGGLPGLAPHAVGATTDGAGGLLAGAGRPSPAAQLQQLAEARAAAASGVVLGSGAGGCVLAGFSAPDLLTRVSLKIMNCLPDELPPDIRARMQAFASQAPLDLVQGCLRPGCTELVLDALLHSGDEQSLVWQLLRAGDTTAAAAALLATLPPSLHCKAIYLQAGDQALCMRPGVAPQRVCWAGVGVRRGGQRAAKPELLGVENPVVTVGSADMEDCVRIRVHGRHLTDPGVTLLARMAGLSLPVSISPFCATTTCNTNYHQSQPVPPTTASATAYACPSPSSCPSPTPPTTQTKPTPPPPSEAAAAASYSSYDVVVHVPYNAPPQGLLILEPRAGVLLGGWAPVLLLEDATAASEVEGMLYGIGAEESRRLVTSLGLFVDHAERCNALTEAAAVAAAKEEAGGGMDGMEGVAGEVVSEVDEGGLGVEAGGGGGGGGVKEAASSAMEEASRQEQDEEDEELDEGATSRPGRRTAPCWPDIFGGAHGRLVQLGRSLLAYSALRGCSRLMSYLGAQLVEMGESLAGLLGAQYGGCELLAAATCSGSVHALAIAAEWAARGRVVVDWRAAASVPLPGDSLLHLAACLPLPAAVSALDMLWALALSAPDQPRAADAFATAWFADNGSRTALSAPSVLFHTAIFVAAADAAASCNPATVSPATTNGIADAITGALSAHAILDQLDRLCLMRLVAAYVRTHNYNSPLDHVELPSLEASSCSPLSGVSLAGGGCGGMANAGGAEERSSRAATNSRIAAAAIATAAAPAVGAVGVTAMEAEEYERMGVVCQAAGGHQDDDEGEENANYDDDDDDEVAAGVFRVQDLEDTHDLLRSRSSRCRYTLHLPSTAAAGAEDPSSHGSVASQVSASPGAGLGMLGASGNISLAVSPASAAAMSHHQLLSHSLSAGSPSQRMRVSVAPKVLAQAAAAAAAAAASGRGGDASSSWHRSGADASLVLPSGTTNATTTMGFGCGFGSGSIPAFGSTLTAGGGAGGADGMGGSSFMGSYSQTIAAVAAGMAKPPLPMAPLLNMSRPLPESSPSTPDAACEASSSALLPLHRGSDAGVGTVVPQQLALAAVALAQAAAARGGAGEPQQVPDVDARAALRVGTGGRERGGDGSGKGTVSDAVLKMGAAEFGGGAGVMPGAHVGVAAEDRASRDVACGGEGLGLEGGGPEAAEGEAGGEVEVEGRRGQVRGLARMFKRLFKKGSARGISQPE